MLKFTFALLFIVNSCSNTNSLFERKPASFDNRTCFEIVYKLIKGKVSSTPAAKKELNVIYNLYPDLSREFIDRKIIAIDSEFMFYRSFVHLFYEVLERPDLGLELYSKLMKYKSHSLVDFHLDNFGPMYAGGKKFLYTMNDPDEGAIVPLPYDFLRYLTGIVLHVEDVDFRKKLIKEAIEHYKKGLDGRIYDLENTIYAKKLEKLKSKELGPKAKELIGDKKLSRELDSFRVPVDLNQDEISHFQEYLSRVFEVEIKILDSFKFLNVTGGSGGLMRYRVLVHLDQDTVDSSSLNISKTQIFEFKQIVTRDLPLKGQTLQDRRDPIKNYQLAVFNSKKELVPFYGIVPGDEDYFMRPRWSAFNFPAASELEDEDELLSTVKLQASTMGHIHQLSLGNKTSQYANALEEISDGEIQKSSEKVAQKIAEIYNKIK